MDSSETTSSSRANYEAVVREMIRHENELMNHRMTWLSTFHGLLFAALSLTWHEHGSELLIFIFAGLGILVSFSSITVLRTASKSISDLADWWEERNPSYQGPGVIGRRTTKSWQRLFYPWNFCHCFSLSPGCWCSG